MSGFDSVITLGPYQCYSTDMAKNTMSWYVFDYLTTCLGLVSQGLEGQADRLGAVQTVILRLTLTG